MEVYRLPFQAQLLSCLLALASSANAATLRFGQIDFQVVHPLIGKLSTTPAYFAIRTKEESLKWLAGYASGLETAPASEKAVQPSAMLPSVADIDFEHFELVVASSGVKMGTGNSIAITGIVRLPAAITVFVQETSQTGNCVIATAVSNPVAMALIPRTDEAITFRVSSAESECSKIKTVAAQAP